MTVLFVTIGKPGHGKSYVARIISKACSASHIQSDVIRKEDVAEGEPTYSSEESHKTYNLLFDIAKNELNSGINVVLDATFNKKSGRERAEQIAEESGSKVVFIKIECDEQVAKKRIKEREGISDADVELYEDFRIAPIKNRETVTVDNSGTMEETKKQVEKIVKESI